MRIDRLQVRNFKGFEDREFLFHPHMNLVVGENGAGKTSLLDALAVALGGWLLGIRGADTRPIRGDEIRLSERGRVGRKSKSGDISHTLWERQFPCGVAADGVVVGRAVAWEREINSPVGRTKNSGARPVKALGEAADRAVRKGDESLLPLIGYYGTGRLWDTPRSRVDSEGFVNGRRSLSRFEGYRNCLDPRISVQTLVRWIARQNWIAFQQGGGASACYRAVTDAMIRCVAGATSLYFDARRGEVVVNIEGQPVQPFSNLSDGQRTMLALVGDLAQRAASLNPYLAENVLKETPGVVLIDELDLHLHPIWQRTVIESLRAVFPSIQFIATTHSPFLIQSLRSGEELLILDGAATAPLGNKTIEDIATGIMGVPAAETSERYGAMKETAVEYLKGLEAAPKSPERKRKAFEKRLAESIAPYADNPAYQAFLEMQRAAKLGK